VHIVFAQRPLHRGTEEGLLVLHARRGRGGHLRQRHRL
jgi:hypothetical protein